MVPGANHKAQRVVAFCVPLCFCYSCFLGLKTSVLVPLLQVVPIDFFKCDERPLFSPGERVGYSITRLVLFAPAFAHTLVGAMSVPRTKVGANAQRRTKVICAWIRGLILNPREVVSSFGCEPLC